MALHLNSHASGLSSLLKEGSRHLQGAEESIGRNIAACKEMAQVTRSSFGPNGRPRARSRRARC